jgi:predicted small lipoprotein YifL
MKKLFAAVIAAGALAALVGCGELGPESDTAQEEELDQTTAAPDASRADPFDNPEPVTQTRVPGE